MPSPAESKPDLLQFGLLLFMATLSIANGAIMVLFSEQWYMCLVNPARAAFYSAHFVTDVGTAYVTIGAAMLWAALRPQYAYPLIGVALLFSVLHAVHHVYEYASFGMPTRHALVEALGIWGPVVLLAGLIWRRRGRS